MDIRKKRQDVLVPIVALFEAWDLLHLPWLGNEANRLGCCFFDTNRGDFRDGHYSIEGLDMLLKEWSKDLMGPIGTFHCRERVRIIENFRPI